MKNWSWMRSWMRANVPVSVPVVSTLDALPVLDDIEDIIRLGRAEEEEEASRVHLPGAVVARISWAAKEKK